MIRFILCLLGAAIAIYLIMLLQRGSGAPDDFQFLLAGIIGFIGGRFAVHQATNNSALFKEWTHEDDEEVDDVR